MLIKKEYQLQVGDVISYIGPDCQNVGNKKEYEVVVKEVYSHWVLGEILYTENMDGTKIKIGMSNVNLAMQGIYSSDVIDGNQFNVPVKRVIDNEQLKKIEIYNATHIQKFRTEIK